MIGSGSFEYKSSNARVNPEKMVTVPYFFVPEGLADFKGMCYN